jgi:2-amino-4-hydroxy-6-hydroxymethyldihydropteridine diphosphokinase
LVFALQVFTQTADLYPKRYYLRCGLFHPNTLVREDYFRSMGQTRTIYLCIGGNLGEREANLEETLMFLEFNFGDILQVSSVYESDAWEMTEAPPFLNQVVCISTNLNNDELMQEIAELEEFYGRERSEDAYLSREMDIDVLFIDDAVIDHPDLIVPHPKMHLRKFVLLPLAEISPDMEHPALKKTISALLDSCPDNSNVRKI